jgi:molybdopterin synthase catalytic subunit
MATAADCHHTQVAGSCARRALMMRRTGVVAIGEASVVIAASSVHRKAAMEAVHFAIDELKGAAAGLRTC